MIKKYREAGNTFYEVYVNVTDKLGVRHQKRLRRITSKEKARQIEHELIGEFKSAKGKVPSWAQWLERSLIIMAVELKPSSVIEYKTRLNKWVTPYWSDLRINEITKQDVHCLIFTELRDIKSDYTRRNILKMIHRILQLAVEEGQIDSNPCRGLSVKVREKDPKVLSSNEATKFLALAKETNHRFYPVWVMALLTGMRSGEMYALVWDDVDFDNGLISVNKQWTSKNGITTTKTSKSRKVPISAELDRFLKSLRLSESNKEGFVLPRLKNWENGEQARVTKDFCLMIGITPVKFHDLRATFITNLFSQGVPTARVMAIVGHTDLKTTNVYLRKAGIEIRGATDSLSYSVPSSGEAKVLPMVKEC